MSQSDPVSRLSNTGVIVNPLKPTFVGIALFEATIYFGMGLSIMCPIYVYTDTDLYSGYVDVTTLYAGNKTSHRQGECDGSILMKYSILHCIYNIWATYIYILIFRI